MDKSKIVDLLRLSEFKKNIINLIPTKTSQLQNDSGFGKVAPLTTSLAVTEERVSALDGTVGKVLNDKGEQMSVYKGTDEKLHFRDWNGADTVIPFFNSANKISFKVNASTSVWEASTGSKSQSIIVTLAKNSNGTWVANKSNDFNGGFFATFVNISNITVS